MDFDRASSAFSDPRHHDSALKNTFKRSSKVSEVENKFLVTDNDPKTFEKVKQYFKDKGWIRYENENYHLLTRQLDTRDRKLLKKGDTIRIRGACREANFSNIVQADLCVKTGKSIDQDSHAVRRGEYEAIIPDFNWVTFDSLFKKFPKKEFPEIHDVLKGIDPGELHDFFRIDCSRNRYLIEPPESETGLAGKRFVAELVMDKVTFILEVPGLKDIPMHSDLEVECEVLMKPCSYDHNPASKTIFSSPLTPKEAEHGMTLMHIYIEEAGAGALKENLMSKAERGFSALEKVVETLCDLIMQPAEEIALSQDQVDKLLKKAFRLNADVPANDNRALREIRHHMSQRIGPVEINHPLATRAP